MSRIEEIESRLSAIRQEMDGENSDITALSEEADKLLEERKNITDNAEKRKALIGKIAGMDKEGEKIPMDNTINTTEERTFARDSVEYRTAWLHRLQGIEWTAEERAGMTSATASGGYAIPTVIADEIIENMVKVAPMLNEIDLMHIPGNITIPAEGTVNAAAIHTETNTESGSSDTLTNIDLSGYELMKLVPISAKLNLMATPAFEKWIVNAISRKLAELIENYVINGTGSSQPKGIDAAATWTDGTNAVAFTTAPTIADIEEMISLQNAAYIDNAKWLMNWNTFWTEVHVLRDEKNPTVCEQIGGKWFIFGFPVIFSAKAVAGDMFFGDFFEGVKGNMAADVTVEADRSSGFRSNTVDYRGTCIFDCKPVAGRFVKGAVSL